MIRLTLVILLTLLTFSQGVVIRNENDTDNPVPGEVFYVDPDWGGSATGAAATPWVSLDSGAWTSINSTLAFADVTVYFSARVASSDANQPTTTALNVLRTDTSAHRLVLDGSSQYNTNDSAPVWVVNTGARKYQITANYPVSTGTGARSNITLHGFRLIAPQGQIVYWWGGNNVIIEDNEGSATMTNNIGPGIYFGYTQHETTTNCPTPSDVESCVAFVNLTIRRNYMHDTEGESIYVGGCANQPGCSSHDGVLVENNTVGTNLAIFGGEPDAIDLKDGLRHVIVRGNSITGQTESRDGVTTESAALIEQNYIAGMGRMGINFSGFWNRANANRIGAIARNNIIINTGLSTTFGFGARAGIQVEFNGNGGDEYSDAAVYNNSIYRVLPVGNNGWGITVGSPGTSIRNNIVQETTSEGLNALSGVLTAKDHNLFFKSGTTPTVVTYGGSSYTTATITSFDANSLAVDPLFVSTNTPYTATNFSLQGGSSAIGAGVSLASLFTTDYAGSTRGSTWDLGAWKVTP